MLHHILMNQLGMKKCHQLQGLPKSKIYNFQPNQHVKSLIQEDFLVLKKTIFLHLDGLEMKTGERKL